MKARTLKLSGLGLALTFAVVGLLFLLAPEAVLRGTNALARVLGMKESPLHEPGFFSIMASAYMAVVTVLAWRIFRSPDARIFPLLLAQAKAASSLFSLGLFFFFRPDFVLLLNGIVDGILSGFAFLMFRSIGPGTGSAEAS
jgi:hypothetical protein